MDTVYSASAVARELGTNVPRILRTARRLGLIPSRARPGVRVDLTSEQVQQLRDELGISRTTPGFSRVETHVLAALARSPRGVLSGRAIARRAHVSPTAATRALAKLAARGLVQRTSEMAALGRAREVGVYRANVAAPAWHSVSADIARVRPPRPDHGTRRPKRVPTELRHLFWNTAPSQLDVEHAGGYIARRLIQIGDLDGLAWGAEFLRRDDWLHAADTRGLAPDMHALAMNLAEASPA